MLNRSLAPLLLVFAGAGPATAEVKSVTTSGFKIVSVSTIAALPIESMRRLVRSDAGGARLTPSRAAPPTSASSCAPVAAFCERLKGGGSVQHLQVVYAAPGEGLRLRGALGPLQVEGVDGTLAWTLKPAEDGTSLTQSYVVGGYIRSGMEQWAPRVDRVLDEQLRRLKSFVEDNSPTR
jgi:hypothetical protein